MLPVSIFYTFYYEENAGCEVDAFFIQRLVKRRLTLESKKPSNLHDRRDEGKN